MFEKDFLKLANVICNDIGIGVSAKSILAYCTGIKDYPICPPYDAYDFQRCYNLLSSFPEFKDMLKDIGKEYKEWGTVGEHWEEIEEAYQKGDLKTVNQMLDKYRLNQRSRYV